MDETRQLAGGQLWRKGKVYVDGWDSGDGNFRIIPSKQSGYILIAFEHERDDGELWTRTFPTVEAAMEQAEKM
jgi:hypothetical protein